MPGGIPSGSDPGGFDPTNFSIVGAGVNAFEGRSEANVRSQLESDVQNDSVLTTMSSLVFGGINAALGLVGGIAQAVLQAVVGFPLGIISGGIGAVLGAFGGIPASQIVNAPTENLVMNPQFTGDLVGWVASSDDWIAATGSGHTAPGSAAVTCHGTVQKLSSRAIAVVQDNQVTAACWVKSSAGTSTGSPIQLVFEALNSGGAVVDTHIFDTTTVIGASSWLQLTAADPYVVPAGVAFVRVVLRVLSTMVSGTVSWDDVDVRKSGGIAVSVVDGLGGLLAAPITLIGGVLDGLWSGFTGLFGVGMSTADVANAAATLGVTANTGLEVGEWNNAVLGIRNNKSLMSGMDETEESNFLMTDLFTGAADPPIISATAANVPVAYWRAEENAKKGFISWWGQGFASITSLFIDLYKYNPTTQEFEFLHSSDDQIGQVLSSWSLCIYFMDLGDRIDVVAGDIIGVAWRVVGAGTHEIAGKIAGSWLGDHPTVIPKRPASVMTGVGTFDATTATYSGDIPWFGIGIVAGDIPPDYHAPRTTTYTTPGTYTYDIPPWANFVDGIYLGGGGGGCGGSLAFFTHGEGGDASIWVGETLERGVDFPGGTTTLTIVVGDGGAAGPGNTAGGAGGSTGRAAITSGAAAVSSTGGNGGDIQDTAQALGDSPGDFTYNSVPYVGGVGGNSVSGNGGFPGGSPGSGGGGGAGGTWGVSWPGGVGGTGTAWLVARA